MLVRDAMPGFEGPFDRESLIALALRDDVESRLVVSERGRYTLAHGPFRRDEFRALPSRGWTLLVQGLNLHSDAADALLRRFAFLPFARLDDLMAAMRFPAAASVRTSTATMSSCCKASGVGAGVTAASATCRSYRDFRSKSCATSRHRTRSARAPATCSICHRVNAHDGVALDECVDLLDRLPRRVGAGARAGIPRRSLLTGPASRAATLTPDCAPSTEPARIDGRMHRHMITVANRIRWDARTVARFLGSHLSEPKATVVFDPPPRRSSVEAFVKRVCTRGLVLDRRTQLLYDDDCLYINGTATRLRGHAADSLRTLANARRLSARDCAALPGATLALLHDWYGNGFLSPADEGPAQGETRLDTLAAQVDAIDTLIDLATTRLLVFDRDLSEGGWNGAARADRLAAFLRRSRNARLSIIVHESRYSKRRARDSPTCSRCTATRCRYGAPAWKRAAQRMRW